MYRVFIVEDEDIIRKGLIHSVPWASMDCTIAGEACNGAEGVEKIRELQPDIVIVDLNMPIMGGLQMLEESSDCNYSSIILTGYSDFEYARAAISQGVSAYLLKPLDMNQMREAIDQAQRNCSIKNVYLTTRRQAEEMKEASPLQPYDASGMEKSLAASIIAYIEANYHKKILMKDLVEEFCYSETFLNKKFKEVLGITFHDYLNRYRIQKALELLRDHNPDNGELAWRCGFGEYKYFSQVFKKYMGCSPKEYREILLFK